MKLTIRSHKAALLFLFAAVLGSGAQAAVAAPPAVAKQARLFTAFDEGLADGRAYRSSVQRNPKSADLITQQVQAAHSAAAANPATALYFQGYVAGLEPNAEPNTLVDARTR